MQKSRLRRCWGKRFRVSLRPAPSLLEVAALGTLMAMNLMGTLEPVWTVRNLPPCPLRWNLIEGFWMVIFFKRIPPVNSMLVDRRANSYHRASFLSIRAELRALSYLGGCIHLLVDVMKAQPRLPYLPMQE